MAENTCTSVIKYQNADDIRVEPFLSEKTAKVQQMLEDGKTELSRLYAIVSDTNYASRPWVDYAAAQEFIDFVLLRAQTYNIVIESTGIEDL